MSKDKKRDETKKTKKISVEAEVALLGLLLSIASLIGLLNQGWLGGFLTYCLVYLFGSMYFIILLFNIYLGLFLFFKKKKPSIILGINGVAVIFLLCFLLIESSKFDGASLNNWYSNFSDDFNDVVKSSFRINISNIDIVGGGLVGYGAYSFLVSFMGSFVTQVVVWLIIGAYLYILLKKPSIYLYKKIKKIIEKMYEKKKSK